MKDEKVAVVTGASRGIGRALAIGLAADGYKIVAMARSIEKLNDLAKEAEVATERILPIFVDMSDEKSIAAAVRSIPEDFGRIELLINNAGEGGSGTLEVPFDKFLSLQAVNLAGPFRLLQEIVPKMIEQKSGTIINIASRAGKIGFSGWGAYASSKFGLVGLNESIYRELAPKGIKVMAICPGWTDTDMAREGGSPLKPSEMIQGTDILNTVRWLLSLSPAACVREVMIDCRSNFE